MKALMTATTTCEACTTSRAVSIHSGLPSVGGRPHNCVLLCVGCISDDGINELMFTNSRKVSEGKVFPLDLC